MENPHFLRSGVREKLTLENIEGAKHVTFQVLRERESALEKNFEQKNLQKLTNFDLVYSQNDD